MGLWGHISTSDFAEKTHSGFLRFWLGHWRGQAMETQVGRAQQLPLDLSTGLEVQPGRQRDGDVDEEAWGLFLGADHLDWGAETCRRVRAAGLQHRRMESL